MSTVRLTFLYPALFRVPGVVVREGAPRAVQKTQRRNQSTKTGLRAALPFSTSTSGPRAAFPRHGSAVEPLDTTSPAGGEAQPISPLTKQAKLEPPKNTPPTKKELPAGKEQQPTATKDESQPTDVKEEASKTNASVTPEAGALSLNAAAAAGVAAGKTPKQAAADVKMKQGGPMEAVLHMPPPASTSHPHISASPYVHNFDTYTLVKQLETGGYSKDQATTAMKAIRRLLAHHLEVAQEGLVSKSDVDNVSRQLIMRQL